MTTPGTDDLDQGRDDGPRSDELFVRGLEVCTTVVVGMADEEWDLPSPCEGWTDRDVLGHLISAMRMGLAIMRGEPVEPPTFDRPGDLVGSDPVTQWDAIRRDLLDAVDGIDLEAVLDTPMGRRSVAEGLAFPAIDLFLHAWDISKAAGRPIEIPTDVMSFTRAVVAPFPQEVVRGGRVFGPEVTPPQDATPTEVFVAFAGREPR